jgi:hypothetical protein
VDKMNYFERILHSPLTCVSLGLAVTGLVVGLLAARYWYRSSKIEVDPGWAIGDPNDEADALRPIEPVESSQANADWIVAVLKASTKSSDLNREAAILTAWAVVLSGLSAVAGSLAGFFH